MERWNGPRGTFDHPASALTLRLVLATFGLVVCTAGAVIAAVRGWLVGAFLLAALAVIAVVDMIVIQRHRHGH